MQVEWNTSVRLSPIYPTLQSPICFVADGGDCTYCPYRECQDQDLDYLQRIHKMTTNTVRLVTINNTQYLVFKCNMA